MSDVNKVTDESKATINRNVSESIKVKPNFIDYIMIILAILSVLLLVVERLIPLDPVYITAIIYADLVIVAIFFTEFMVRIRKSESKIDYAIEHWYEIIGMIPAAHPVLRGFRLFRIFRVFVITSRLIKTVNLSFGQNIVSRILNKYKDLIVEELYQVITLRALDMVKEVLEDTDYTNSVQKVLNRRREDVTGIITLTMDNYAKSDWIKRSSLYKKFKNQTSDIFTNIIADVMEDERMNALLTDIINEIITDIKANIENNT